jgi:PIN domain nuclease of toxin-antitoxin system
MLLSNMVCLTVAFAERFREEVVKVLNSDVISPLEVTVGCPKGEKMVTD